MQYRNIGRTDLEVSAVAMGCWPIVGDFNWGPQQERDSIETIEAALDVGVNTFDTAEAYGDGYSEELLGRVLEGRRDQVVLASKAGAQHLAPDDLKAACEASLTRLRTDYLDLYQIHWPSRLVPFEETMRALEDLQAQGKVRVIGCSNFGPRDLAELLGVGRVESNQFAYSMLWRGLEAELAPLCEDSDVSLLPYCPLQQGLLTGKFASAADVPDPRARTRHFGSQRPHTRHGEEGAEGATFRALDQVRAICRRAELPMAAVALAWLLARPCVACVLAGARTPEQMRANAAAADLKLPGDVVAELTLATDPLKDRFAGALDMWQSDERIR